MFQRPIWKGCARRCRQRTPAISANTTAAFPIYSPVTSFWRPLDSAAPYSGTVGQLSRQPEVKVEVTCATAQVEQVLAAIRRAHPYEEPVVNVIPLYRTSFQ